MGTDQPQGTQGGTDPGQASVGISPFILSFLGETVTAPLYR